MSNKITITPYIESIETHSSEYGVLPSFKENDVPLSGNNGSVDIEVQEFYDNSINLIVNDEKNLRIINSGFAINDGKIDIISRNNDNPSNEYYKKNIDQTNLILSSSNIPQVTSEVVSGGNLMGGNYFFYIKYGTSDTDVTNILGESKVISIFHGDTLKTTCGTLEDERVNKSIKLTISNVDTSYSKVYLYYSRYTSDTNGIKLEKYYKITDAYNINSSDIDIIITGDEEVEEITEEDINIQYHNIQSVKSIAQNQGMLFLAGLKTVDVKFDKTLEEYSLTNVSISAAVKTLSDPVKIDYSSGTGYCNPTTIADNSGYWPEDFYRLGIVYIYKNGETSCVYNIKGGLLYAGNNIVDDKFENNYGVFYTTVDNNFYTHEADKYISLNAELQLSEEFKTYLTNSGVCGYFIVRQQRDPLNITQGIITRVEERTGFPSLRYHGPTYYNEDNPKNADPYAFIESKNERDWVESFLMHPLDYYQRHFKDHLFGIADNCVNEKEDWFLRLIPLIWGSGYWNNIAKDGIMSELYGHYGILNLDSYCVNQLQSLFSANEFIVRPVGRCVNRILGNTNKEKGQSRQVIQTELNSLNNSSSVKVPLIYVPWDTPSIYYNNLHFSTRAGNAETTSSIEYIKLYCDDSDRDYYDRLHNKQGNASILRGNAVPYIGICKYNDDIEKVLTPNDLVNIRTVDNLYHLNNIYSDDDLLTIEREILKRKNDNSPFYAISPRVKLENNNITLHGGDCFINTVTIRMQTNFIDPETQTNDSIVDPDGWNKNYKGISSEDVTDWTKINRSDINSVKIGTWYTFKYRSNYNLGIRSEDKSNSEEISKMGNWRSFYPKIDINPTSAGKVPETSLLNLGLSSVLSARRYYNYSSEDLPYSNNNYANRIMFSNMYVNGAFENGYRVFQGLSYRDYTREYGSITKILSLGQSLFTVFENGCAIIPINEKALINTTEGQSIHMYGAGVLPEQITVVSQNFGSKWKESVIMTPNGIYGVDTDAKAIWRYDSHRGFMIISDQRIKSYLDGQIKLENTKFINGIQQVRTHYNSSKKDVMFTFKSPDTSYNLCFNEILDIFVCKYTWCPQLSVNTNDNLFYSFNLNDKNSIKLFEKWNSEETDNTENSEETNDTSIYLWKHDQEIPTKWYGEQSPFEIEFVVNNPNGLHKIFDNLVIISNNVEPESLEIEIEGDVYNFDKAGIINLDKFPKIQLTEKGENDKCKEYYTKIEEDRNMHEYHLKVHQDLLNIKDFGRRLGNIHYTEDKWNITLQPIYYKDNFVLKTARIRDKYAKIRIKYKGDKLVVITAIQTLFRLSYA